ncbi:MAG: hypothetical protein IT173_13920 [Acidobacteria bacterium]|nr:hypothetical protein [Acidobacteriota bacterium]
MKLPNIDQAVVRRQKVVEYLLSLTHRDGRGKARFFLGFGFESGKWQVLADALKMHASTHEVTESVPSPFGIRYIIDGELQAPDGRRPRVRAVWFIEDGDDIPAFVTAYPAK